MNNNKFKEFYKKYKLESFPYNLSKINKRTIQKMTFKRSNEKKINRVNISENIKNNNLKFKKIHDNEDSSDLILYRGNNLSIKKLKKHLKNDFESHLKHNYFCFNR